MGYVSEVRRWIKTHGNYNDPCPGVDFDFITEDVCNYLRERAKTTKALSGVLSALKQMGMICGQVLHTSKFQQPSLQYQKLRSAVSRLHKGRRDAGLDTGVDQAIGTGRFANSLLLSGFSVFSFKYFHRIHPLHREFIVCGAMQYKSCSRFGLFNETTPLQKHLHFAAHINSYRLASTFRKTHKSNRPYSLTFPVDPSDDTDAFTVRHPAGPTMMTAGTLIHWHLRSLTHTYGNQDVNAPLFPLMARLPNRRASFAKWLREMYTLVLPIGSTIPARIRPHSNRAGWLTDHARAGTSSEHMMAHGRWKSRVAMNTYIRPLVSDLCHSSAFRYIPKSIRKKCNA